MSIPKQRQELLQLSLRDIRPVSCQVQHHHEEPTKADHNQHHTEYTIQYKY